MGLFGRGGKTSSASGTCTHPPMSQVWLREDKADKYKTTATKCNLCGKRLPSPVHKDNKAG